MKILKTIVSILSIGLIGLTLLNLKSLDTLKAKTQVAKETETRLKQSLVSPKKSTSESKNQNLTTQPNTAQLTVTGSKQSDYESDPQISKLSNVITAMLTYTSASDLKKAYTTNKDVATGSIWGDIYGKLKDSDTPAIDAFADQIDALGKTSKVTSCKITKIDNTYHAIVTIQQGGDSQKGAVNGSSIYHITTNLNPNNTFTMQLADILVNANLKY